MATTDQILRDSGYVLSVTFEDQLGEPIDEDTDTVDVEIYKVFDDTLVDSGSATSAGVGTGTYTFVLSPQSQLVELYAVWSGPDFGGVAQSRTTYARVIGSHLFTVSELRAYNEDLDDPVKYPAADIVDHREQVTELFEKYLGVPPVAAGRSALLDGNGEQYIYVWGRELRELYGLLIDEAVINVDDVTIWPSGRLYLESGGAFVEGRQNIEAEYELGFVPTPGNLSEAAMIVTSSLLAGNDQLDRTITHTDETGTYRLSIPDQFKDNPTGIPWVDAVLNQYRFDEIRVMF